MLLHFPHLVAEGVVEREHGAAFLAQVLLELPHRAALQPLLLQKRTGCVAICSVVYSPCRTLVTLHAEGCVFRVDPLIPGHTRLETSDIGRGINWHTDHGHRASNTGP